MGTVSIGLNPNLLIHWTLINSLKAIFECGHILQCLWLGTEPMDFEKPKSIYKITGFLFFAHGREVSSIPWNSLHVSVLSPKERSPIW